MNASIGFGRKLALQSELKCQRKCLPAGIKERSKLLAPSEIDQSMRPLPTDEIAAPTAERRFANLRAS
jgi:hypothetical protein